MQQWKPTMLHCSRLVLLLLQPYLLTPRSRTSRPRLLAHCSVYRHTLPLLQLLPQMLLAHRLLAPLLSQGLGQHGLSLAHTGLAPPHELPHRFNQQLA
jgi:hypothetical protein